MYKTAIQPILTYGCSTIKLKPNDIDELEKVQASLIKAALGLSKYSRNTPILRALKIKKIGRILDERHLSLTRAALHNTSKSRTFYLHIMHKCQYQHMNKHCNLLQRSKQICNSKGIMLLKYLFDESYAHPNLRGRTILSWLTGFTKPTTVQLRAVEIMCRLYTHTPHTLLTYTDDIHTHSEFYAIHGTCVNSRKRVSEQFNLRK